jgi:hypothetical protein
MGDLVAYRRPARLWWGALAAAVLLVGCSGGGGSAGPATANESGRPASSPTPSPGATPTGLDFTPDPGHAPKDRAQALRMARKIAPQPRNWGPGFVERSPGESDPASWTVLGRDCVWHRQPLPATVLASITRYSELPAEGGKGPVRIAAVVTVHRSAADADWEMAGTLEEALRCPDQQLRQGERITGLLSQGVPFGLAGNFSAEDALREAGEFYSDELGGPHYYGWTQSRLGQVTIAAVAKGAKGRSSEEIDTAVIEGMGHMLTTAESELEAA